MKKNTLKGRGTAWNPPNRYEKYVFEQDEEFQSEAKKILTQYYIDASRSAISKNDSPDVDFDYSFNPYRGCEHGCVYCYARPTHSYLGFGAGLDFESKIMVKPEGHLLLEKEFQSKKYKPDVIIFSGNTDCYQPVERNLGITRKALEICLKYRNPVSIITKGSLVQRDVDILSEMAALNLVHVTLSITTLDNELSLKMEPRTASPGSRINTLKVLSSNGIPCGVNVAPIIPGITESEIPAILEKAAENGATQAGYIILRLPLEVKDLFLNWLETEYPGYYKKTVKRILEMRGGVFYKSDFGTRFHAEGEYAELINNLFDLNCKKLNLNNVKTKLDTTQFHIPDTKQYNLF